MSADARAQPFTGARLRRNSGGREESAMPDFGYAVSDTGDSAPAAAHSPVVQAAERLVGKIEALVHQVSALRSENASLRREVRDAVALLDRAGAALGEGASAR